MAAQTNVVSIQGDSADYPLANSEATRMLAEGLKAADEEKGLSQRTIAKMLNYKSSVVLSHMALGRVPIPIDRALEISRLLKLDSAKFLLAVLQQRHPDIDFIRLLGAGKVASRAPTKSDSYLKEELEAIAGRSLDDLPVDKADVMREVVGDANPARRWVSFNELPTVELIRQKKPRGITAAERIELGKFLDTL
jgi:hypothetical protein